MKNTNWAENLSYSTNQVLYPEIIEQVQEIVQQHSSIKALGSRHSFNTIADSTTTQLSLQNLNKVVALDKVAHTVTVEGGVRYGELAPYLQQNGYALPNLASLPHISIAGACATATHGSGLHNGSLATAVVAMELINAAGELVYLSAHKHGDLFNGAVVHLGALGIITKLTLALQPTFNMKQVVYRNLPMQELEHNFKAIMSAGYSVSLFTTWENKTINQVWIKSLDNTDTAELSSEFYGAVAATQHLHPLEELSPEHATDQLGTTGTWYEKLPHFKMGFQPSAGKELQSEYFVAIEHAYNAMLAITQLQSSIRPHLFVSEIRTIAEDNYWMSPFYKQTCIAFHFTWKQEWEAVSQLLPLIEEALAPYNPVPHWGKLFALAPARLQARYSRMQDFIELIQQHDPQGKFRNKFLEDILYQV